MNSGDTAFVLVSTALVFFMTPGLAFFYCGMVRRKNVINTIMSCFFIIGLASVMWVLIGYSLSFGHDTGGIIGNFQWFGMNGVTWDPNSDYSTTIPHNLFAAFQMMFAIITPALIVGAVVERMRFSVLIVFIAAWSLIVYYPLAHMMWGVGGILRELGAVDFAGGTVIHMSAGISALVASVIIGRRRGQEVNSSEPHNIPLAFFGAAILWLGWFGFNSGCALGANGLAVHVFINTNTAAATAMLVWMLIEKALRGKFTLMGTTIGGIVGLIAITPASGFVPIWASFVIGAIASPICYFAIRYLKVKLGYDDTLDVFGCHGVAGLWGVIATGLFTQKSINSTAKWNGLLFGDTQLFKAELISILVTIILSAAATGIILGLIRMVTNLRVSAEDEETGLDISEHGENAYSSLQEGNKL